MKFQKEDINAYLSQINIHILTDEGPITKSELLNVLNIMPNNKSRENDDLTKRLLQNLFGKKKNSFV